MFSSIAENLINYTFNVRAHLTRNGHLLPAHIPDWTSGDSCTSSRNGPPRNSLTRRNCNRDKLGAKPPLDTPFHDGAMVRKGIERFKFGMRRCFLILVFSGLCLYLLCFIGLMYYAIDDLRVCAVAADGELERKRFGHVFDKEPRAGVLSRFRECPWGFLRVEMRWNSRDEAWVNLAFVHYGGLGSCVLSSHIEMAAMGGADTRRHTPESRNSDVHGYVYASVKCMRQLDSLWPTQIEVSFFSSSEQLTSGAITH
ncbi:hypothetical protein AG1IA_00018 [Rhizoctonia solani AG-1 IA]|uniref:Uncharacterized protein n=1 Tax=Thanatephorus cucumeris (strain AG1-IA) TaxID=983506 RepID=L8XA38_THACA|nr:hypothetical protein AG1IA_00018 [Rhizoctonia solani AG-1 IA]